MATSLTTKCDVFRLREGIVMFCTNCGKQIADNSTFCPFCGTKIIESKQNETVSTQEEVAKVNSEDQIKNVVEPNETKIEESETLQEALQETATGESPWGENQETQSTNLDSNQYINLNDENIQHSSQVNTQEDFVQQGIPNVPLNHVETNTNDQSNQGVQSSQGVQSNQGVQKNQGVWSNVQQNEIVPKKKKGKTKLVIVIAILVLLIAGGSIGGYFGYQKYLSTQPQKVIKLYRDGEYEEALELYEKKVEDRDELKDEVLEELSIIIGEVKDSYLSEEITFSELEEQLEVAEDFANRSLKAEIAEITIWARDVEDDRAWYKEGMDYLAAGDYDNAIYTLGYVSEIDMNYYLKAQQGIKDAEKAMEEAELLAEQERLEKMQATIELADSYAANNQFQEAIDAIYDILYEFDYDDALYEKIEEYEKLLDEYETLYYQSQYVYDYTYETYEKEYYDGEEVIYSVSFEYIHLSEDNAAYNKINATIEQIVTDFSKEQDTIAESITYNEDDYLDYYSENYAYLNYNDDGLLCLIFDGYEYTGGDYGTPKRGVYYFDLSTGEQLSLGDIIADEVEFKRIVVEKFSELIEIEPDAYVEDALAIVEGYEINQFTTYLNYDEMIVYLDANVLSPNAEGFIAISISLEDYAYLFPIVSETW